MGRLMTCLSAVSLLIGGGAASQQAPLAQVSASVPLDAGERNRTVGQLAELLSTMYLKPEVGVRYAAALRTKLRQDAYHTVVEGKALAERLTSDLRSVSPDVHLRILPNEAFQRPPEPDTPSKAGLPEGIEEMRMIGRVAYLRFTAFPHDPRTAPAARAFLLANAGRAKAVIIDGRPLPGGGLEVMDAMLPLFFSKRTILARLETRAAGDKDSPFSDGVTLIRRKGRPGYVTRDHIVRPDAGEKRLRRVPLYYLTSTKTASAGEHLASALKRTRRATLIGEKTRGAGHYVALAPVGARLTALVPVGRAFDPDTGLDWEGRGVSPDVAVPADAALDEALRRIGSL